MVALVSDHVGMPIANMITAGVAMYWQVGMSLNVLG